MRIGRHRGSIAGLAVLVALGLTGCGGASESSDAADDPASNSTERPSTSTSTTVPRSTTSMLPACSTIDPATSVVNPAVWLPVEVPDGWRLDAAATVGWIGIPGRPGGNRFVVLDGDTVTGVFAVGTGEAELISREPVTVRGAEGSWGSMGGRSMEAANPYLVWREDGVDWWITGFGVEKAALIDAVADVELSDDPVRLNDPTGRLVQVNSRPAEGSTMVLLSYEAPDGTAPSLLGGGTASDGGETTDRVQVVIEQFAPGGSGILVDNVNGSLGQVVGWQLVTVGGRPVLRTPDDAEFPVVSGEALVVDGPGASVAVSVTGSPSAEDADAVMARVTPVEPSDERLSTARVDVGRLGEIDLTACLPD